MNKTIKKIITILIIVLSMCVYKNTYAESAKAYIDYPIINQEVKDTLKIQGWAMSQIKSNIKVYIDNEEIEVDREIREDVYRALKEYNRETNPNNGFIKEVDIKNLSYGDHIIKVQLLDESNNILLIEQKKFIRIQPKSKICIDNPSINQQVIDTLKIQGWVMSQTKNNIKVYIDNEEIEVDREIREDVYRALKEYNRETNPNNGFIKEVDIKNLSYGDHIIKVQLLDESNNVLTTQTQKFIKGLPKTKICIDNPTSNKQVIDTLKIQGWAMSQIKSNIKVYIDNEEIEVDREIREDVYRALKEYNRETNPNNGFIKEVDIKNKSYGEHEVKVQLLDESNNILTTQTQKFIKGLPKTKICIDNPTSNKQVVDTLKIQGWVMSQTKNNIKVYIDNEEIEVDREIRNDVYRAVTEYGTKETNPNNGFIKEVDIRNKSYGEHKVKIEVLDENNNLLATETKKIIRKKPNSIINIDLPTSNIKGTTLIIDGWYLSEARNTHIEIYLDTKKLENIEQKTRNDVYNVFKDRYGRETIYPGYKVQQDISQLKDGNHNITFKIMTEDNKELLTKTTQFYLKKVDGKMCVETIEQSKEKIAYYLSGWEMSTIDDSYIKTYIDNVEVNYTHNRIERNDVTNIVKGYGDISNNQKPGYMGYVDISNINVGEHDLNIKLYSKYGEQLSSFNQKIYIVTKKYETNNDGTVNKLQYDAIYYNQYDNRWANIKYGFSNFGSTGCAPTSMAMAFSGILGKKILPTDLANYLYYNTNEYNKYTKGTSGLGLKYASKYYHIKTTEINSLEDLNRELQEGKIVFCAMGNGIYGTNLWNHAIILKEYNNGKTYSYDPLKTSNNMWINTSTVWSQRSIDADDYRGGSVFYALESYY